MKIFRLGNRSISLMALTLVLFVGGPGWAQKAGKGNSKSSAAPQKMDEGYTAKIREYTTEPFFLTELVDHLPAGDKVATPEKSLGYVIGTPNKLTYSKDIYRYMRELEKASPRVKVFSIGRSEEDREMILVAVSDSSTRCSTTIIWMPAVRRRRGRRHPESEGRMNGCYAQRERSSSATDASPPASSKHQLQGKLPVARIGRGAGDPAER